MKKTKTKNIKVINKRRHETPAEGLTEKKFINGGAFYKPRSTTMKKASTFNKKTNEHNS